MTIFNLVFLKVISSFLSVVMGFIAGKYSNVERDSIVSLLFYFVAPVVFFAIPTNTQITLDALSITIVTFFLCSLLSIFCYWLYGKIWQDSHRNILALSSGTGNSGYVVLPIASALFDDHTLSIYALGLIGVSIYEVSIGCYYCAMSTSSFKQSVFKIIRLPLLNAFFLGCLMSIMGFKLPDFFDEFTNNMKGAFSILGMLTIGLSLAKIEKFECDWKFIGAAFCSKFLFYPIIFNIFIILDRLILGWFDASYYNALQLLSVAPLATNTIVIASLYKTYPEKMATAVLISLLFVLIYIPIMATLFLTNIQIS